MEFIKSKLEHYLRNIFEVGIFLKGINGIWETAVGASILFVGSPRLISFIDLFDRMELFQHSHYGMLGIGMGLLQGVGGAKTFIALYFLIHGLVNIFLSIQLYRNRLWAYLVTMGAMSILVVYQMHRIFLYHSKLLTVVTLVDALFIILTWHEYRHQTSPKGQA
ncbi:MAG: DUF2127 domain-containing protein [Candidatus Pacebacteria bacterium]|nr:DUF2127 domain-containing protein [Candidatus Paceibacterota bacterium]